MLGYCGINCEECAAYKGTVGTDVGLLKKVAGIYGDGAFSAPDWVCLGCTPADQGFLAKDCATCKIRRCAIEKKVQNCAACDTYESCQMPKDLIKGKHEALWKRMEWLRRRFLALQTERPGGIASDQEPRTQGGAIMLGYCGINCEECPAYKGTVTTDMSLLEKSAGSFWNGAYSAQEWVCLGCTPANQGFLAKYCATCKIRTCAIAKRVPNCAACADCDTCEQLKAFIKGESEELGLRMTWLQERFKALAD